MLPLAQGKGGARSKSHFMDWMKDTFSDLFGAHGERLSKGEPSLALSGFSSACFRASLIRAPRGRAELECYCLDYSLSCWAIASGVM